MEMAGRNGTVSVFNQPQFFLFVYLFTFSIFTLITNSQFPFFIPKIKASIKLRQISQISHDQIVIFPRFDHY